MSQESPFTKDHPITDNNFGACDVYYVKPGGVEEKHYHDCVEIIYVHKGNCTMFQEGKTYTYQKGEIHELINDSSEELILVCLTIPPETKANTHYVE